MVNDARQNTKDYLEARITASNILKDDGSTYANWIVCFGYPEYPLQLVFQTKAVDLVFSIGTPDTEALPVGVGYMEHVPITIHTIDKPGITGTKLRWTAEEELRSVMETYPLGSLRTLTRVMDEEKRLGSTTLYSVQYVLGYKRYA